MQRPFMFGHRTHLLVLCLVLSFMTSGVQVGAQMTETTDSATADLAQIGVSEGMLSPPFMAAVTNYTVQVDHTTEVIAVTFQKISPLAELSISLNNGPFLVKEQNVQIVELPEELTIVKIRIVSEDTLVTKVYQLQINRVVNQAPSAQSLSAMGEVNVGATWNASYVYEDAESNPEGASRFQWLRADDGTGKNKTAIAGANERQYVVQAEDAGKFLAFQVTPVAQSGEQTGQTVQSEFNGPIQNIAPPPPPITANVMVNGEAMGSGYSINTEIIDNKKYVDIFLNSGAVGSWLGGSSPTTVKVTSNDGASSVSSSLSGQTIRTMAEKGASFQLDAGFASYTVPAAAIDWENVRTIFGNQIGTAVSDQNIQYRFEVEESKRYQMLVLLEKALGKKLIIRPIEYRLDCLATIDPSQNAGFFNYSIDYSVFNGYVEKTAVLPNLLPNNSVTTGVVVDEDGNYTHVPTKVSNLDGKYLAIMNSLTNSVYAVISNFKTFTDIQKHWAKASIENMASRLIVNGMTEQLYDPNRAVTRAEFATMLVRAMGLYRYEKTSTYTDVPKGKWYNKAVQIASEFGFIKGYPDGSFRPDGEITREEAAVIMSRAMSWTKLNTKLAVGETDTRISAFKDQAKVASFAKPAVALMVKYSILGGYQGQIQPKTKITRAETAVTLERLLKKAELI